ncbi:MAG: TfoX/Sxy family protein [Anaerolineae bacterium]|nr:TfoX/Sxy family protein [Anaerolineae bacterium]
MSMTPFKNIGPKTLERLQAVGVSSLEDLEAMGAVEVYRQIKAAYPRDVSIVALYALQGALLNLHWNALPPEMKAELRAEAESF